MGTFRQREMEDDIGVKLFHRGTRKITLTNEVMLLRRRAEEILQLVDNTEKELVEQEEQIEGKITIGCGELASVQILKGICECEGFIRDAGNSATPFECTK